MGRHVNSPINSTPSVNIQWGFLPESIWTIHLVSSNPFPVLKIRFSTVWFPCVFGSGLSLLRVLPMPPYDLWAEPKMKQ